MTVKFGPGEEFMVDLGRGKLESVINIDGVSRRIMEEGFNCDFDQFVRFTKAIRQWCSDPGGDGKPATAEQLKRFDEAVLIAIADKSIRGA